MNIEELSSLYAKTQAAFDDALRTLDMSVATELQVLFDDALAAFKEENPDVLLFINCVSREITIREPEIKDE